MCPVVGFAINSAEHLGLIDSGLVEHIYDYWKYMTHCFMFLKMLLENKLQNWYDSSIHQIITVESTAYVQHNLEVNYNIHKTTTNKQTPWPFVCERTISTKIPPFVSEVTVCQRSHCQLLRIVCVAWSALWIWPYSRFSRPEPLLFLPSSSLIVLMGLSGSRSRPTTSQKNW
jgi:hypothetical protein